MEQTHVNLRRPRNEANNPNQPPTRRARTNNLSLNSRIYPLKPAEKILIKRQLSRSLIDEYLQVKWPIRNMANYLLQLELALENLIRQLTHRPHLLHSLANTWLQTVQDLIELEVKDQHSLARHLLKMLKIINANDYYQRYGFKKFYKRLDRDSKERVDVILENFAELAMTNSLTKSFRERLLFNNRPQQGSELQRNYSPEEWGNTFPNRPYAENIFGEDDYIPINWQVVFARGENNEPSAVGGAYF